MITDRLETLNKTYDKQFNVYETIYFDNINGCFNSFNYFNSYIPFELKFVIFHFFYTQDSGHYVAYCKIKGEWHLFNDLNNDYAKKESQISAGKLEELFRKFGQKTKDIINKLVSENKLIDNDDFYEIIS